MMVGKGPNQSVNPKRERIQKGWGKKKSKKQGKDRNKA